MRAANAHCFSESHWRVIACGHDVERWFGGEQVRGTGGILMPREVDLPAGHRYYRFATSTASREAQVGGGWWLDYEGFATIDRFAHEHGYGLPDAARLFLALPYDWSRVDRLVTALLAVPLRAYAGKGKPAAAGGAGGADRGTRWIPLQQAAVTQLYIPGLVVRRTRPTADPQLYEKAFPSPTFEYIAGNRRTAPAPR